MNTISATILVHVFCLTQRAWQVRALRSLQNLCGACPTEPCWHRLPCWTSTQAPGMAVDVCMVPAQMNISQQMPGMMPPGITPTGGIMPQPPMVMNGGDFMAMQLSPGMPSSAHPGWPDSSMPMPGMPSGCSAPMVSSIPREHSAAGPSYSQGSGRGRLSLPLLWMVFQIMLDVQVSQILWIPLRRPTCCWCHTNCTPCFAFMQVAISILTLKSDADLTFLDGSGSYSQSIQYQHGMPNGLHCTAGVPTRSTARPAHSVRDDASQFYPRH